MSTNEREPYARASFLQVLSRQVTYCSYFRIQRIELPIELESSSKTLALVQKVTKLQKELKASIKKDYERQRGVILSNRVFIKGIAETLRPLAKKKKVFDKKKD